MGLVKKAVMVITGLIVILFVGDIIVSVNPELTRIFSENSVFAVTGGLTLILLALLGLGLVIRIILNLFEEDDKQSLFKPKRPTPRRFNKDGMEAE